MGFTCLELEGAPENGVKEAGRAAQAVAKEYVINQIEDEGPI